MRQSPPSFWRQPVEPWQIVEAAVLVAGLIVVSFIDEHLMPWWFLAVVLASPALLLFARRKK